MFLQDISFVRKYNSTPNVFVSANHSSSGGNRQPEHNGITAWVEVGWKFYIYSTVSGNSFKAKIITLFQSKMVKMHAGLFQEKWFRVTLLRVAYACKEESMRRGKRTSALSVAYSCIIQTLI